MPHFIVDCSASILTCAPEIDILQSVRKAALKSGLFDESDIKVRVNPYANCLVGTTGKDFVHVFSYILEGRSEDQKATLSKELVRTLAGLYPHVENIACSVEEFSLKGYCNRKLLLKNVIL